jgi:hypothetical protein
MEQTNEYCGGVTFGLGGRRTPGEGGEGEDKETCGEANGLILPI